MKKLALIGLSALTLASTAAEAAITSHSPYIGLMAGGVSFRHKADVTESLVGTNSLGANRLTGALGAVLGWGAVVNTRWHVAAELDGQWNPSSEASVDSRNFTDPGGLANAIPNPLVLNPFPLGIKIKSDWAFGAALRAGYWLNDASLLYVRAGIEARRFECKVNLTDPLNQSGGGFPSLSFSPTKIGFTPGVGVETSLSKDLSLGAEARMAFYQPTTGSATLAASGNTVAMNFVPNNVGSFMVSLRYKLGSMM